MLVYTKNVLLNYGNLFVGPVRFGVWLISLAIYILTLMVIVEII